MFAKSSVCEASVTFFFLVFTKEYPLKTYKIKPSNNPVINVRERYTVNTCSIQLTKRNEAQRRH